MSITKDVGLTHRISLDRPKSGDLHTVNGVDVDSTEVTWSLQRYPVLRLAMSQVLTVFSVSQAFSAVFRCLGPVMFTGSSLGFRVQDL